MNDLLSSLRYMTKYSHSAEAYDPWGRLLTSCLFVVIRVFNNWKTFADSQENWFYIIARSGSTYTCCCACLSYPGFLNRSSPGPERK